MNCDCDNLTNLDCEACKQNMSKEEFCENNFSPDCDSDIIPKSTTAANAPPSALPIPEVSALCNESFRWCEGNCFVLPDDDQVCVKRIDVLYEGKDVSYEEFCDNHIEQLIEDDPSYYEGAQSILSLHGDGGPNQFCTIISNLQSEKKLDYSETNIHPKNEDEEEEMYFDNVLDDYEVTFADSMSTSEQIKGANKNPTLKKSMLSPEQITGAANKNTALKNSTMPPEQIKGANKNTTLKNSAMSPEQITGSNENPTLKRSTSSTEIITDPKKITGPNEIQIIPERIMSLEQITDPKVNPSWENTYRECTGSKLKHRSEFVCLLNNKKFYDEAEALSECWKNNECSYVVRQPINNSKESFLYYLRKETDEIKRFGCEECQTIHVPKL